MRQAVIIIAVLLASCSRGDVRDTPINEIDFRDMSEVNELAQELTPQERASFRLYALGRTTEFGGEVTTEDGSEPATIREAIALVEERKARNEARNALLREINDRVSKMNSLIPLNGRVAPEDRSEVDRLESEIGELRARLRD